MHRFLALYEKAWAQPATGLLAQMWAPDAEMMHPELEQPVRGRDAVMAYLQKFLGDCARPYGETVGRLR
jgi:SnoaL-like domain